jgi:hypothetical protein
MVSMAFDSLRYARRLREAGVPEPQVDLAELIAEAFGFYAENLLTRDHFTEVLNARFAESRAQIDQRFAEQDAKFDQRVAKVDRRLLLLTWMLGLITLTLVIPQLQKWFSLLG